MKLRPFTEYNADARVIGEPKIGRDCWIGPFTILDASGGLEIGDHCTIAAHTSIYTHQSGAGRCSKIERKPVKIGSNVYVGPHVVISMGVTIGDGAVIGANSFVDKDVIAGAKLIPQVKNVEVIDVYESDFMVTPARCGCGGFTVVKGDGFVCSDCGKEIKSRGV